MHSEEVRSRNPLKSLQHQSYFGRIRLSGHFRRTFVIARCTRLLKRPKDSMIFRKFVHALSRASLADGTHPHLRILNTSKDSLFRAIRALNQKPSCVINSCDD